MKKVRRNDPCPCGSGQKFKKCCLHKQSSNQSISWTDDDGIHLVSPGSAPSPEQLKQMTKQYQKRILNSPVWDEMVRNYGKEKAGELLKDFKAEIR